MRRHEADAMRMLETPLATTRTTARNRRSRRTTSDAIAKATREENRLPGMNRDSE